MTDRVTALGGGVRMAADRGHDVQRTLAHNPRLPLDVLPRLSTAARIGSTLLPRVSAANPSEAEELSRSSNPAVRMLLAQRRDLPAGISDRLAADPDTKVVKSIARHPGLSGDQLRTIVERHGVQVMAGVTANPDTPPDLLEELSQHDAPARRALREIARHPHATGPALLACLADSRARPLAARHPALPPRTVVELLADDDWQVVEAAAANPSLPPAVMRELVPGAERTPATPTGRH